MHNFEEAEVEVLQIGYWRKVAESLADLSPAVVCKVENRINEVGNQLR